MRVIEPLCVQPNWKMDSVIDRPWSDVIKVARDMSTSNDTTGFHPVAVRVRLDLQRSEQVICMQIAQSTTSATFILDYNTLNAKKGGKFHR